MIVVNLYYTGQNGSAVKFVEEMVSSGIVEKIKQEQGNLRYEYFFSQSDPETVLLIDAWENQRAIDLHHCSEMMGGIVRLREKYDLHMKMERYESLRDNEKDEEFLRK